MHNRMPPLGEKVESEPCRGNRAKLPFPPRRLIRRLVKSGKEKPCQNTLDLTLTLFRGANQYAECIKLSPACKLNMKTRAMREKWLGRQDSNLGMAIPKTAALPLGHAPTLLPASMPAEAGS